MIYANSHTNLSQFCTLGFVIKGMFNVLWQSCRLCAVSSGIDYLCTTYCNYDSVYEVFLLILL